MDYTNLENDSNSKIVQNSSLASLENLQSLSTQFSSTNEEITDRYVESSPSNWTIGSLDQSTTTDRTSTISFSKNITFSSPFSRTNHTTSTMSYYDILFNIPPNCNNKIKYPCGMNADCAPRAQGVKCHCKSGYSGNPYDLHGLGCIKGEFQSTAYFKVVLNIPLNYSNHLNNSQNQMFQDAERESLQLIERIYSHPENRFYIKNSSIVIRYIRGSIQGISSSGFNLIDFHGSIDSMISILKIQTSDLSNEFCQLESSLGILSFLNQTFNCTGIDLLSLRGDIDECIEIPPCKWNTKCQNTIGSYKCACKDGFKWIGLEPNNPNTDLCAMTEELLKDPDRDFCTKSNPCSENAICSNSELQAVCECMKGFIGDPYVKKGSCIVIQTEEMFSIKTQYQIQIPFYSTFEETFNFTDDYREVVNSSGFAIDKILSPIKGYILSSSKVLKLR